MNCPRCNNRMTVANSRTDNSTRTCYRRYRCPECGKELLTTEAVTERYSTLSKLNKLQYQENKQRKLAKEAHKRAMTTDDAVEVVRSDCNGCKFVGTYDTEFPCAICARKTKDYYEPQTERSRE